MPLNKLTMYINPWIPSHQPIPSVLPCINAMNIFAMCLKFCLINQKLVQTDHQVCLHHEFYQYHSIIKGNLFDKTRTFFFKVIFHQKCKVGTVWNQFIENIFKSCKSIGLSLFKMAANQIECSRLEQKSLIKFLVAEECKPCEIYRRKYVMYREACFSFKISLYIS